MIGNYFLVAFRNLRKNKIFSFINIAGLAIGISASLVIYMLVYYDFSFDKFHKEGKSIYRVVSELQFPGQQFNNGGACTPLSDAMRNEVTGLETVAAFYTYDYNVKVSLPKVTGDNPPAFRDQKEIVFADGNYFRLFSYQWLAGSAQNAFDAPFKVVLTESRAQLYFPGIAPSSVVGRTILYNDTLIVSVSGVVKDLTETTDLRFKEFISLSTIPNSASLKDNMSWGQWTNVSGNSQIFVKLNANASPQKIESQLVSLRNKYSKDEFMKTTNRLQPIADMHFTGKYDTFGSRQANKTTLYGLLAVAAFLLLLGCINFINLTTAQAAARAKEIGIRKTMGSSRANIVFQFLGETLVITLVATVISLALIPLLLKMFSDFIPPDLSMDIVKQPQVIAFIILLVLSVSLFAGFYPALVLSKFNPALVLKNQLSANSAKGRKAWLRKSLTVSQFVIAQFLIIATMLVSKQINYALNVDMGFKKDAIVTVRIPWNAPNQHNRKVLLQQVKDIPGVENAALAGEPPATQGYNTTSMKYSGSKTPVESMVEIKGADSTYFQLYNLPLIAGRYAIDGDTSDREFVINEAYAKVLGFNNPSDAVGEMVERGSGKAVISGVVKNFHQGSVHSAISPLVFNNRSKGHRMIHILLKPQLAGEETWKNTLARVEQSWKGLFPEFDFKFDFLDENIAAFYKAEQNMSRLLKWSTMLAIFISCLGMLGLVIYATNQRVKEIGVRKVLGASVSNLVALLSKEFIVLVVLAFLIAAPLAWLAISDWLNDFAFRTSVSWWIFAAGGLIMLAGALLTLSFQTVRSAMANPVKSLRSE